MGKNIKNIRLKEGELKAKGKTRENHKECNKA